MANKYNVTKDVFSKRLRKLMLDNNETTYSVAEIVNLSAATISRYADGKMAPKITTITHLANHYNVNPVWLMGYDVPKVIISENTQHVSLSDKEKNLLDNYNKLNSIGKEKLLEYSDDLVVNDKYTREETCCTMVAEEKVKYITTNNKKSNIPEEDKSYLEVFAAHDREGEFSEEDIQHDLDIMNDENF